MPISTPSASIASARLGTKSYKRVESAITSSARSKNSRINSSPRGACSLPANSGSARGRDMPIVRRMASSAAAGSPIAASA